VAVYDLALLLGYPRPAAARWIAVLAAAPLAIAFERFDGAIQRAAAEITFDATDGRTPHVRAIARAAEWVRPVVAVEAVLDTIRQRSPGPGSDKER
jgi:hypothetical protein